MSTPSKSDDHGRAVGDGTAETAARSIGDASSAADPLRALSTAETEALVQVLRALRSLKFGSLILNVHDGVLMEIHKTEKIRIRNRS
jgi:hypothetical protein